MEIRKLTETDYAQVAELHYALDTFHVQARPDFLRERTKEEIYPKMPICITCLIPADWKLVRLRGSFWLEPYRRPYGKKAV